MLKSKGTIKIVRTDTGEIEYTALFDAKDVVAALTRGEKIEDLLAQMNAQEVRSAPPKEVHEPNSFPVGM
jgi:hypothetical protein